MAECNNLSGTQLLFQRSLEDAKRLVKYKINFKIEELGDSPIKLYDLDSPAFISSINKIHNEQGRLNDQSGQRSYHGFTIDIVSQTDLDALIG